MIITSALLLIAAQAAPVKVIEVIEPSQFVVVQAFVKAPASTERVAASWQVLGRVLLMGTEGYTGSTIREYGSQAGIPPQIITMPDYMRIQFVLPKEGLSLAGDLLFSIMTRPAFREQDISKVIADLQAEEQQSWTPALEGVEYHYDQIRKGDVERVWKLAMRPENLTFIVGGNIVAGTGINELTTRFEKWSRDRSARSIVGDRVAMPAITVAGSTSVFLLQGKVMKPDTSMSAAKLLSIFALGVGKDATMFRVLREDLGLSYFQGAVLWPSSEGWIPKFLMVRKSEPDEGKYAVQMKEAMLADIENWDRGTLQRAMAMATAAFTRPMETSPIWLDSRGAMSQTLIDRCAWRGYLEMIGTGPLRTGLLLGAMSNVDLDQIKEQAREVIDHSNVGWIPGSPH